MSIVRGDFAAAAAKSLRLSVSTVAAALFFAHCTTASATTVTYTGYSWTGRSIHITDPRAVTGGAGQITLTGVKVDGVNSSNILAWCLDVLDNLISSGTYIVGGMLTPSPPIDPNHLIGGLMLQGNSYLAAPGNQVIDGKSYNDQDVSAATQVAIWQQIYGTGPGPSSFHYNDIGGSLTDAQFATLVTSLINHAPHNVSYSTLNPPACSKSHPYCNQNLGYAPVPVPGPAIGAGLPAFLLASGLLAWRRRKKARAA